jgi:MoaA/NifB/PqqE/SkfB family radical SAM enzyme
MQKPFCKRANIERIFRNHEGVEALCCKMLGDLPIGEPNINKIHKRLQKGATPAECNVCWKREANGLQSWRQQGNKIYKNTHVFKKIEIIFDNTCDSSCIYCSGLYSSQWEQEIKKSNIPAPDYALATHATSRNEDKTEKILEYLTQVGKDTPLNKSTELILLGGEPLLTSINKKGLLEICIEKFYEGTTKDKNLLVVLQTNCNTPEPLLIKTIKKLKEYKTVYPNIHIDISVSGESVGKNYEYVRYGSSYEKFVKNLNIWMQEGFYVTSNMSINCVTLNNLKDYFELFVELCKQNNTTTVIDANLVFDPIELSINILDKTFEKYIKDAIVYLRYNREYIENSKNIIANLNEYKKFLGTECNKITQTRNTLNYFTLQRNVNIKDINLELYEYLTKQ